MNIASDKSDYLLSDKCYVSTLCYPFKRKKIDSFLEGELSHFSIIHPLIQSKGEEK